MQNQSRTWEDVDFRKKVFDVISTDSRFDGMSGYLSGVRMCWSYTTPTICSGHGYIFVNPDWWDIIPDHAQPAVIYMQGMALLSRHLQRGKGLHPYYATMASQYVLTNLAVEVGFDVQELPFVENSLYGTMSLEEIYLQLTQGEVYVPEEVMESVRTAQIIEDMIVDLAAMLENDDFDLDDEIEENEQEIIRTIDENPSLGCGDGTNSAGFDLNIGMGQEVIVGATYEEILAPYMETGSPTTVRSYRRPSRRSTNGDFIRPGRVAKKGDAPDRIKHLYLLLDVSGSIGEKQAKQFNYSAQTIKKILDPELMTVMFFDTEIKLEKTFTADQKYTPLKVRAGGGTNLGPAYRRIAEIDPEVVLIFTDLQVDIPPEQDWDTIWLVPETNCAIPNNLYGNVYLIPERER